MTNINMNEIFVAKINMAKPTMVKLLTMSKMYLAKINMNEIIMAKSTMAKLSIKLIMNILIMVK
jgi:hypothetical protein